jgi:hypothetical protein
MIAISRVIHPSVETRVRQGGIKIYPLEKGFEFHLYSPSCAGIFNPLREDSYRPFQPVYYLGCHSIEEARIEARVLEVEHQVVIVEVRALVDDSNRMRLHCPYEIKFRGSETVIKSYASFELKGLTISRKRSY